MANNVLIQDFTIRELSSGSLGPFSFKADEGKVFVGSPTLYVDGNQWDDSSGSIMTVDDSATDYREFDRNGNGIYGTQTFIVTLNYDIGDIECRSEPKNTAHISFPTQAFVYRCIQGGNTVNTIGFNASLSGGDYPIFDSWVWPKAIPSNTFIIDTQRYPNVAMGSGTYSFNVALEANALTFYSSTLINGGPAFTVSGQNSKSVTVSTTVFTGTITIYWGVVTVVANGDFIKGSLIFDNGARSTENWLKYRESCSVSRFGWKTGATSAIHTIAKVGDCSYIGGRMGTIEYETSNVTGNANAYYEVQHSATNAYAWGHVRQDRQRGKYGGVKPIEPYGYLVERNNGETIISIYDTAVARRSDDRGQTWTTVTNSLNDLYNPASGSSFQGQVDIQDITYAGTDSSGNHVWYCFAIYWDNLGAQYNQPLLSKSIDDGKTFQSANVYIQSGSGYDDLKTAVRYDNVSQRWTGKNARLHASLQFDYLFIEFKNRYFSGGVSYPYNYVLFRYFPSQTGTSNPLADVRPVFEFYHNVNTPESWNTEYLFQSDNSDSTLGSVTNWKQMDAPTLAIEPSGLCVVTNHSVYAVSWNFGLNWADETNINNWTVTKTLTSNQNISLVYPETEPSPFLFDGKIHMYTGNAYNSVTGSDYRNLSNVLDPGDRITDGLMVPIVNQSSTLTTGEIPTGWSDQVIYGNYPSLTSSTFGPFNQCYASPTVYSYGNGKGYIFVNYQLDLDPTYTNRYWFTYDFKNDTDLADQYEANFGGGILPNPCQSHGDDFYFNPSPNGVVTTRNLLYKSTDDMVTPTLVFTGPSTNSYTNVICEYDGSSNNFLVSQDTNGSSGLYYSTDGVNFYTVANLSNIGGGVSYNSATNAKYFYYNGNCRIENGYIYLLDDVRYSTNGTLGRSYVIPVSEIADASTWSNYEITSQLLNYTGSYFGVQYLQVIGSKAMLRYQNPPTGYGPTPWYYSTNNGSTWTQLAAFTDTSGNSWSMSDITSWFLYKNHYAGQFILHRTSPATANKAGTVTGQDFYQVLWTEDFVTWDFAEWSAEDPNGDNYTQSIWQGGVHGNGDTGDISFTFRQNPFTTPARKVTISDSTAQGSPLINEVISGWDVIKEYDYLTNDEAVALGGSVGFFLNDIYIDKNTPSGEPMAIFNHIYSTSAYPSPEAPVVSNTPNEITAPVFTGSPADFTYTSATQCRKIRYQSDQVFSLVWTKPSGQVTQFDGLFDITVYTISDPVVINGFAGQTVNILHNELLDRELTEPNASLVERFNFYMDSEIFGFVVYNYGNNVDFKTQWRQNNTYWLQHTNSRSQIAGSSANGPWMRDQLTYVNDFAVQIPLDFDMTGKGIFTNIEYPELMFCFPPKDKQYVDIIGLKLYSDFDGKPYPDGYYWMDNWYRYEIHPFTNNDGTPGTFQGDQFNTSNVNTYMYLKNGFVTELGNAKDLPNYDQC